MRERVKALCQTIFLKCFSIVSFIVNRKKSKMNVSKDLRWLSENLFAIGFFYIERETSSFEKFVSNFQINIDSIGEYVVVFVFN